MAGSLWNITSYFLITENGHAHTLIWDADARLMCCVRAGLLRPLSPFLTLTSYLVKMKCRVTTQEEMAKGKKQDQLSLSFVATITVLSIKMNLTRFQFCKWIQLLLLDRPAI